MLSTHPVYLVKLSLYLGFSCVVHFYILGFLSISVHYTLVLPSPLHYFAYFALGILSHVSLSICLIDIF